MSKRRGIVRDLVSERDESLVGKDRGYPLFISSARKRNDPLARDTRGNARVSPVARPRRADRSVGPIVLRIYPGPLCSAWLSLGWLAALPNLQPG